MENWNKYKPSEPKKISILVVEDSRTQAIMITHLLSDAGYSVRIASNGKEALTLIKEELPNLILTDIVMPEMNGYELCKEIKNNEHTADIPVILVTQLFDPQDVIEGLECGADNFIIKPYDNDYLLSRIKIILANRFIQQKESMQIGIEIYFAGKKHYITSNRLQILNILLSTYEIAIQKNNELIAAKESLSSLNEQLQDANFELSRINKNLTFEISERKRAEQALSISNKKLALLSSLTRHDIKNTLTALFAYNEIAEMDATDEIFHAYLQKEQFMLKKLQDQIEFTRLYEELGSTAPMWVNINSIIQKIVPQFPLIKLKTTEKVLNLEIYVDPLIEKVFYNLIENSIRHGEKITTITIDGNHSDNSQILLISDDGIGISENEKEVIFKRGYGKNTGLGLFLVREVLSITGITISEIGKEGEGACFSIKIPHDHFRNPSE